MKPRMRLLWVVSLALLPLLASSPAFGQLDEDDPVLARTQYFWTPHFYVGLHGDFVGVQSQKGQGGRPFLSHGGGAGLLVGSRLGRYLAFEFDYTFHFHPTAGGAREDYVLNGDLLAINTFLFYAKLMLPFGRVEPTIALGAGLTILDDFTVAHEVAAAFGLQAGARFWVLDRRRGLSGYGKAPLTGVFVEPVMTYLFTAASPDLDTTVRNAPVSHLMGFHIAIGLEFF